MKIKIMLIVIMIMGLCIACGNKKEYHVENEDKAIAIYKCPADNMFGVEKIVVFENEIVTVFDKKINDRSEYGECEAGLGDNRPIASSVRLDNLSTYKSYFKSFNVENGKYISVTKFEYDPENRRDKNADVAIRGVCVLGQSISFNDGNLILGFEIYGGECIDEYSQTYDLSKGTWNEIESETIFCPLLEE